ncbi:winged helix-turn-helix domain-containing protein, partial [Candidatus Izimaplasma bacterium]|nr:winged helix-turn-helix domain-containing protein [Candidatus Izimaplasma bacterium]
MILDMIEKDSKITQRKISSVMNIAVSMVNSYLSKYEESGYIKREYYSAKNVSYKVTKKGAERKKVLNIRYLEASYNIYQGAKQNIDVFLQKIIEKGFCKIMLYGGGEVAEILLQTILTDKTIP